MCTSCNCGTQTTGTTHDVTIASAPTHGESAAVTTGYTVMGMTCDHCVASVAEEIGITRPPPHTNTERQPAATYPMDKDET
jgi:hypothetical protein